jgi:hypothetical protein
LCAAEVQEHDQFLQAAVVLPEKHELHYFCIFGKISVAAVKVTVP